MSSPGKHPPKSGASPPTLPPLRRVWAPRELEEDEILLATAAAAADVEQRYEAFRKEPHVDRFAVALVTTLELGPFDPFPPDVIVVPGCAVLTRLEQRFSPNVAEWIVRRHSDDKMVIASTATFQIALKHRPPPQWEEPRPYRWVGRGNT